MRLRVGLSGAGYIAPVHIAAWRAAGAEVVAIADPNLDHARFVGDNHGVGRIFAGIEDMIASENLDVLDIASPRQVHIEQSIAGLEAGLSVMCQKPLAPSLAEAEAFAARTKPTDRFMVHENWRFRPPYRRIRQWMDEGRVGSIRQASVAMRSTAMIPDASGIRPAAGRQPFMLKEPRLVVAEVLIHNLDAARYLLGDLSLIASRLSHGDPEIVGETSAALYLETEDRVPVMISGDMMAHGTPSGASDWIEIVGSKGRVTLDNTLLQLHGPEPEKEDFTGRDLLAEGAAATVAYFVKTLGTGQVFETGLADNIKTFRLVDAAYEFANS